MYFAACECSLCFRAFCAGLLFRLHLVKEISCCKAFPPRFINVTCASTEWHESPCFHANAMCFLLYQFIPTFVSTNLDSLEEWQVSFICRNRCTDSDKRSSDNLVDNRSALVTNVLHYHAVLYGEFTSIVGGMFCKFLNLASCSFCSQYILMMHSFIHADGVFHRSLLNFICILVACFEDMG